MLPVTALFNIENGLGDLKRGKYRNLHQEIFQKKYINEKSRSTRDDMIVMKLFSDRTELRTNVPISILERKISELSSRSISLVLKVLDKCKIIMSK
ncbi:uncharacterized protein OCT59_000280 [Rhizophagus irregularis]|uniref:uncharacterized protein n=1 Tax=Rhizophagus irregularis TaxID=588596 RepID=UPI000CC45857|nr:hypothetical protein OCT59_000280 [Rhizophagus irregularis]GBC49862.1 hypothetical protein RIR_jg11347.t1 [Rhizophagus irregularis DAOM 181602=DAOM 197198]